MELFGVGPLELLVIGTVALLVFGPKKLPELAQNVGKVMRGLKDVSRDFEREVKREFAEPPVTQTTPNRSYDVVESVQPPPLEISDAAKQPEKQP
ncbi:TatA/E family twin arginine-targeting protein translocase [Gloeobacter violaceus]|uniref:Gsr3003 protein n=1 Tax=Gloeobacter violaceus (strain ATCC 29082 / PCC 7421) TaxID=251221 RepID=Q7NCH6_GLOVI|nr:TatA/E family twin arginine-targeting protein translocase [Gloeobacter violaceus]BAC90944.1 gsr3003 [Gloeobacter violaceus PCC 7421]